MRTSILLVVCMMTAWNAVAHCTVSEETVQHSTSSVPTPGPSHSSSPRPSPSDCTGVLYNVASCISFLTDDSKLTKPDSKCCSGFKSVILHAGFECICTAVKSSARMGIALNMTKANALSSGCGVSAPPLSHCNAKPVPPPKKAPSPAPSKPPTAKTPTPSPAPTKPPSAKTPTPSPAPSKPPSAKTPTPSPGGGSSTPQLAPAPSVLGGSHSMSASLTFIVSMLVASFSLVSA